MAKPFYEILVRGWPDASVNPSACHIKYWEQVGTTSDGTPVWGEGLPAPITASEIQAYLGDQYAAAAAQVVQLTAEKDALAAERDGLAAQVATIDALKAIIRGLKGTPEFKPSNLLALLTADDMSKIISAAASAPDTLQYYFALQNRAATTDDVIPIDSQTFIAAAAKLKAAIGDARTSALFADLNIDIVAGAYIDAAKAA